MPRQKQTQEGICHLCGAETTLTLEHVPPHASGNTQTVVEVKLGKSLLAGPFRPARGKFRQKGAAYYTLCEPCNNFTGRVYADHFSDFAKQALSFLKATRGNPTLIYPYTIYPLRAIKQIATMMFSANLDTFQKQNQELVHFVLDRDRQELPERYRFFIYYNLEGSYRRMGEDVFVYDINRGRQLVSSELSFPPFGYVMTQDDTPIDPRLVDITRWLTYGYDDQETVYLKLSLLPTLMDLPGDYRTSDEIKVQAIEHSRSLAQRKLQQLRANGLVPPSTHSPEAERTTIK